MPKVSSSAIFTREILTHVCQVPVYDARNLDVDWNRDLPRLEVLPRWFEEIPVGSFVVVGYTAGVFMAEKTRTWTISFNLQWAVIVGVPDDD